MLRRLVLTLLVFVLVLGAGVIALLGYSINKISTVWQTQNFDLLALEHLLTEQAIVLTEQQKADLSPVITKLTDPALGPQVKQELKRQMDQVLGPAQVQLLQQWQSQTQVQAQDLLAAGKSTVSELVSQYIGIPPGVLSNGMESVTAWTDLLRGSANSTNDLLKALAPAQ